MDEILKLKRISFVYAHNFAGFDGVFKPLIFNSKLISITLSFAKKDKYGRKVFRKIFKDSFLTLPLSLRKLCSAFNLTIQKSLFPFRALQDFVDDGATAFTTDHFTSFPSISLNFLLIEKQLCVFCSLFL